MSREPSHLPRLTAVAAAVTGLGAAVYYARLGLTLSHYDAKAHLVVARRILDSLTPGWEQIGAVWLPLPHLLNMLPVQVDVLYRTGMFAIALSLASHAVAAAAIAATVLTLTGARTAAVLGAALYALNPNVLYLQGTPMTEPMLFGLTSWQVYLFTQWVQRGELLVPRAAAWVTVAACLTRYEAWPITAACVATSAFAWWRRGAAPPALLAVYARLARYPVLAVIGFLAFSRITVGAWFVSGGFFVPDDTLRGQWSAVVARIAEGMVLVGGERLLWLGAAAAVVVLVAGLSRRALAPMTIALSLWAAAALPLSAYYAGHPFRMRYEIPLVVASALVTGMAAGLARRAAPIALVLILPLVLLESPPLDPRAAMVREAQLDPNVVPRQAVTACLVEDYRGGGIMMSMGSLGHYMHELSKAGFAIRDFLHEGNSPIWDSAFTRGPAPLVEWVIVEREAEGGDALMQRLRQAPALLAGFEERCAGGGIALYRRVRMPGAEPTRTLPD